MKTNDLRKAVKSLIGGLSSSYDIKGIYYNQADDDALFPHVVFDFSTVTMMDNDANRRNVSLYVDVYDRATSPSRAENIADDIEDILNTTNSPQTTILPTFYLENRLRVVENDKDIKHTQLRFTIQNYKR